MGPQDMVDWFTFTSMLLQSNIFLGTTIASDRHSSI